MSVFDGEARDYDSWYDTKLGRFVDEVETRLAFEIFKPYEGMKVLDAGCGTGNFTLKLAELGCKVVGIDISGKMLDIARGKIRPDLNIELRQMDIYRLDFPDEEFDGVFSMAAFEFVYEPQKAFNEMYRVLKKGGNLLIGTINRESSWGELYLSKEMQEDSVYKYADFKNLDSLVALNEKDLVAKGECLFIPPDTADEKISLELEEKLSETERGGFICAQWKKGI